MPLCISEDSYQHTQDNELESVLNPVANNSTGEGEGKDLASSHRLENIESRRQSHPI